VISVIVRQYFGGNDHLQLKGTRTEFFSESQAPIGLFVSPFEPSFPYVMYHFPVWYISSTLSTKAGNDGNNLPGYYISPP
jgi:hypothetical protein